MSLIGRKKRKVVHESLDALDEKEVKEAVEQVNDKPKQVAPVVAPGIIDLEREYVVDVPVTRVEVVKYKLTGRDIVAGLAQVIRLQEAEDGESG